jgi:hypothetical protein
MPRRGSARHASLDRPIVDRYNLMRQAIVPHRNVRFEELRKSRG